MNKKSAFDVMIFIDNHWDGSTPDELRKNYLDCLEKIESVRHIHVYGMVDRYRAIEGYSKVRFSNESEEVSLLIKTGESDDNDGVIRIRRLGKLMLPLTSQLIEKTVQYYLEEVRNGYLQTDLSDLPFCWLHIEILGKHAINSLKKGGIPLLWEQAKVFCKDFPIERRNLTHKERIPYLSDEKEGAFAFPKFIALESTRLCNLRCKMCVCHSDSIEHSHVKSHPKHFDIEKYKWIVDQVAPYKDYIGICPQFQGEPFMSPYIREMIDYGKGKDIPLGFTTNALLWTDEYIKHMIDANVNNICVSIDGATKETYEKIRIGGNYEKMVQNIEKFFTMRKELSPHNPPLPYFSVNATKIPENEHELPMILDKWLGLAGTVSVNNVCVDHVVPEKYFEPERYPCPFLWEGLHILTNGDVIACCRDSDYEEVMGNSYTTPLLEIWHNEKYQRFRKLHRDGEWNKIPMCSRCDTWMCKTSYPVIIEKWMVYQYPFHRVYFPKPHFSPPAPTLSESPAVTIPVSEASLSLSEKIRRKIPQKIKRAYRKIFPRKQ